MDSVMLLTELSVDIWQYASGTAVLYIQLHTVPSNTFPIPVMYVAVRLTVVYPGHRQSPIFYDHIMRFAYSQSNGTSPDYKMKLVVR